MIFLVLTSNKANHPVYVDPTEIVCLQRRAKAGKNQHTKDKKDGELDYTVIMTNKITSHFVTETPEQILKAAGKAGIKINLVKVDCHEE